MERPYWAPESVDIEKPASSRIYDFFLGGSHNFAADRAVAEQAVEHMPQLPMVLRENRAFLRRAVRRLATEYGVRQFLDLGSGIPTVGNVHEIAQRVDPKARVVYVDIDPVAIAHGEALLADNPTAVSVLADFRDPDAVLAEPRLRETLDLTRPVALLMVAALHFVPDELDPWRIVARLRDALAPGSHLAISHASEDGRPPEGQRDAQEVYARSGNAVIMRTRDEVARFFDGWQLLEPGVQRMPLWWPDSEPAPDAAEFPAYCGLAQKA